MLGPSVAANPRSWRENLADRALVLVAVLACCLSTPALGQSVVPPGATYVDGEPGQASATAARWRSAARGVRPLRVAFSHPPAETTHFWVEARRALAVWSSVPGIPFRFELVRSTDAPDVEFRWIDRFPTSQAGATHRRLGDDGYIDRVTVVLARSHSDGSLMSAEFRRLVALHEVGHVLGLPHSENPGDVMHPGNRNLRVSARDVRSLQSLYRLEP